jgi:putative heme-binding domain-containing protein
MIPRWLLLLAVCSLASAQGQNPFTGDAKEIEVGRATFRIYCSPCHGIQAQGGRGPDLTTGVYAHGNSDQEIYDVIANGIPGTEMPASTPPRMTSDSIWRVVAYMRSIAKREQPSLAGDPKTGEEIFWNKGQCGSCHRVGVRGGRLGTDLSGVGRARTLAYLREAVVAPDAAITPGNATVTVVTAAGERITGVERIFDNFSVLLMDSQENLHSFLRSEVQSVKKEQRSLMPAYGEVLSAKELEDLLSYLAGLGREEASQ